MGGQWSDPKETEYYFKVAALNAVGQGPYGEVVMASSPRKTKRKNMGPMQMGKTRAPRNRRI
jgi:hypothetical protein